jgi:two-component system CheB/CheR fusion protein
MKKKEGQKPAQPHKKHFPIVAIGASAGGLEAFEQFFKYMPSDSGIAFVLIPHLDPGHSSMMPELLKRFTHMNVAEAGDGETIEPNHAYVIPPNRDMAVFNGTLQLTEPEKTRGLRMPIDFFFRSLAEDQGENAVCIILSGTGSDGTLGLRAVHGAGGITMVQTAETAKYEGMPRSAIDTGLADYVLPVEKMPAQLMSYLNKTTAKKARLLSIAEKAPTSLQKILMILRSQIGHDFTRYKKTTISRRIEKRMDLHNIEDITVYVRYLQEHPEEVQLLFKEFLIGVTSFFRDPDAFEVLREKGLPRILEGKPDDYLVRAWVPGCATGEEVYSLAMLFREYLDEAKKDFKLQIFGTDIDEDAIRQARTGIYPDNVAADLTPGRLKRFFVKDEAGYRVKKEIRETVIFAVQNVIKDAPFTKLDLVSCRNLLIYLEPDLQNRLIPLLHYSLKPGGALFLGTSESIGKFTDLFNAIDKRWKFFQAKGAPSAQAALLTGPWNFEPGVREVAEDTQKTKRVSINDLTQRALLDAFVPPSVMVNDKGEILYIHGQTGRYLEPPPGQPTLSIIDMAREGLRFELRSALHSAVSRKKEMRYTALKVKMNGGYRSVNLTVRPLPGAETEGLFLVVFEEPQPVLKPKKGEEKKEKPSEKHEKRIHDLEQDLSYTKESLQATIEELQATNEELRSTNEEFQSTNEELQSTNEELETSKEELQSVNEELVTVNSELQSKIEQLSRTESDMKALLDSVNIGTIFLDSDLFIRRFTAQATKVFNLIGADVGRPIADIRSNLEGYDNLVEDARKVLDTLQPVELELKTKDDNWYLMRVIPSRTPDNSIDGAVATFTNITKMKKGEGERHKTASAARRFAEGIVETVTEPLLVLDRDLRVVSANRSFYEMFKTAREEIEKKFIFDLGNRQWDVPKLKTMLGKVLSQNRSFEDGEIEYDYPGTGRKTIHFNARKIDFIGDPEKEMILFAIKEISEKKTEA